MEIFHVAWQVPRDCVGQGRTDGILGHGPLQIRGMFACGVGDSGLVRTSIPYGKGQGLIRQSQRAF